MIRTFQLLALMMGVTATAGATLSAQGNSHPAGPRPPTDSDAWTQVYQRTGWLAVWVAGTEIRARGDQRFAWQRIVQGSIPRPTPGGAATYTELVAWTQFDCGLQRFRFLRALYRDSTGRVTAEDSRAEPWRRGFSDTWAPGRWACAADRATSPLGEGETVPPDAAPIAAPPLHLVAADWRVLSRSRPGPTTYAVAFGHVEGEPTSRTLWWREFSPYQHFVRGRPWSMRYQMLTFDCTKRTVRFGPHVFVSAGDAVDEWETPGEPLPLRSIDPYTRAIVAQARAIACRGR